MTCVVDRLEMLRYLGYAGQQLEDELSRALEAQACSCERVSNVAYAWQSYPALFADDGIHLQGCGLVLTGASIAAHLHGAVGCAMMVCTLGLSNERELVKLNAVSPADALLFSAAGSSMVEVAADACEAEIVADAAARGLSTNSRFSPGYGDLPLALQGDIVHTLGAGKRFGMVVHDSGFVTPTKSVTAFVGLFPETACAESVGDARCFLCPRFGACDKNASGSYCWLRQ